MPLIAQLTACRAALLADKEAPPRLLEHPGPGCVLFFAISDGDQRAEVLHARGANFDAAWRDGVVRVLQRRLRDGVRRKRLMVRVDRAVLAEPLDWSTLQQRLAQTRRNHFRLGIALDLDFAQAFTEQELNANAMLYGGDEIAHAQPNPGRFARYAKQRFGEAIDPTGFASERAMCVFATRGVYCGPDDSRALPLEPTGLSAGRRLQQPLTVPGTLALVASGARYLAGQVKEDGRFNPGWFACFDRPIPSYDGLHHASATYAMVEAWELTRDVDQLAAIERSLAFLSSTLIRRVALPDGREAAFLADIGDEINLGGNSLCLLALCRYSQATGSRTYLALMEQLALGVLHMQDPESGRFVHVLNAQDLSVKEAFRTIRYDGEAAFGLMRLYGLTRDARWLSAVEKAFEHFIAARHWQAHDHWLSYCVNELTLYRPEERYFRFGLQNLKDHLDFVLQCETTHPRLLELMTAAQQLIARLQALPAMRHLLELLDPPKFMRALHHRADQLRNGYFWPEFAMYFGKPSRVAGSFFVRHQGFRVRIDDVAHYLLGYVAYRRFLSAPVEAEPTHAAEPSMAQRRGDGARALVAWGGDVNLGRRQHFRLRELGGPALMLGRIAALRHADLRIVNLECVVATEGEQGVDKGEGGPWYYRARPEMLDVLSEAGIDIVATANNHAGDYGPAALLQQRGFLDAAGIASAGSGATLEEALAPVVCMAGGVRIAVFSIDATQASFAATAERPGIAWLPPARPAAWRTVLAPRIAAARRRAHVVLVAVHWGANLATEPAAQEIALGHALVEAGADGVLGASAHVLQGVEVYQGRPILYDAGNLLLDTVRSDFEDGGVFTLEVTPYGVERVHFHPVGIGYGHSEDLQGAQAAEVSARFAQQCRALGTTVRLAGNGCEIVLAPPEREVPSMVGAAPLRIVPLAQRGAALRLPPVAAPQPGWTVDAVPEDARIEPLAIGPLRLVGLRCAPERLERREILWVESYWSADAPLTQDLRLWFRAVHERPGTSAWGEGTDHDPCDWMWPTSRWQPGTIYRDRYGLRPPQWGWLRNGMLQLELQLVGKGMPEAPLRLPVRREVALPELSGSARANTVPATPRDESPVATWTADTLARVTGGRWLVPPPPGWQVRSVVRASKHLRMMPGPTLFVASDYQNLAKYESYSHPKPETWDRHRDLPQLQARLAGAVVRDSVSGLAADFPLLQVDDPIGAAIALGDAARKRFRGKVAAVTGTVGKSSTVATIRDILPVERVVATIDNYNSRVGVPLMLANLAEDDDACVLEMSMSALWKRGGPISLMARPHVAVITEIGLSQANLVTTLEATARSKSLIFKGLEPGGAAVIGEHLACLDLVRSEARRYAFELYMVGTSPLASVRLLDMQAERGGCRVRLSLRGRPVSYRFPLFSEGMVRNSAHALAAAHALGYDLEAVAERMASVRLPGAVMERSELRIRGSAQVTMIDDSWNAEVLSMHHAMDYARRFETYTNQTVARKIAMLGSIVYLGEASEAMHRGLAGPFMASGIAHLVTHGEEMRWLRDELPAERLGPHCASAREAADYLADYLRDGDLLLIKGDRMESDFGEIASLLRRL